VSASTDWSIEVGRPVLDAAEDAIPERSVDSAMGLPVDVSVDDESIAKLDV
jgi:hypothetical protein